MSRNNQHLRAEGWMTIGDIAALVNVNSSTVKRWLAAGKIPEPAQRGQGILTLWDPDQVQAVLDWRTRKPVST
jgi:excisionase family DNA binding protein